ncbi:Xenotropic and polytropic retrovirus receptor 1 [Frankliniella fusca]|uniref:Xenotropic and polytropic retrovirus receptor 1 n=1 Tax=Frankliniella fusca TaxID=407009 RepID=A0AAE1HIH9_9NEOP|nr:Xenotropic and polytropic retrovirus receptor 1 [Frankliniella fusca]
MKFAEHLGAHITPEWRKQYINYEEMKAMLYLAVEQAPSSEVVEPAVVRAYFSQFDEKFFHYCDKELTKINTFFSEKLAEAQRKYSALRSEMIEAQTAEGGLSAGGWGARYRYHLKRGTSAPVRKVQDLKLAFSEFYLGLILLQNYQNLNFTGFRKILKKHDKLLSVDVGARWRRDVVEASHFYTNKDIGRLIGETEAAVTQNLEGGDRQRAMKRLRVPPLNEQQSPWTTFRLGLFLGSFVVLFLAVIIAASTSSGATDWRIVFRLYRGPLLVIQFIFLLGINVYGWRSSGVNHVLIFEMDPRHHLSEQHIMELAAIFGVVWALSVLVFLYSDALGVPPFVSPLLLLLVMLGFLFNPTRTLRHQARFWMIRVMFRAISAPFFFVNFADFWMADQLNSLVPALIDFQYTICFYITNNSLTMASEDAKQCVERAWFRPVMAVFPAWLRFAQCLRRYRDTREANPHLANAVKYFTVFVVIFFTSLATHYEDYYEHQYLNPYFYLWILSSIGSSMFAYIWDIKLDWGLFDKNAGNNKFLREEIVYSSVWYYYFGIVEDLLLRFGWVFSLSLSELGYVHGELMVTILSPLEVFRRFVWNFFRLENEHLNNCGKFRAVRDISVAPMETSDQGLILRMMDEEDGVLNRNKRKANSGASTRRRMQHRSMLEDESTDTEQGLLR